jgi:plasmanylethanolamine desaturase
MELAMTLAFPLLVSCVVFYSVAQLQSRSQLWLTCLAVPLGLIVGDFASGVVHWAADTYGRDDTPLIGPSLVRPFRLHHADPQGICNHKFISVVGNSCILVNPILVLLLCLLERGPLPSWLGATSLTISVVSLMAVATNQFHKWAHSEPQDLPNIVRWLQRRHLILSRDHHELHHHEPFDRRYCITGGWLNPLLDETRFFRNVELVLRTAGIEPAIRTPHTR